MSNQRNIMLAVVLSGLLLLGWDFAMRWIYPQPAKPVVTEQAAVEEPKVKRTREGGLMDPAQVAEENRQLALDLKAPGRIPIKAPGLSGSISPVGAVIDDLTINRHRASVEKDSGPTRLFSPNW